MENFNSRASLPISTTTLHSLIPILVSRIKPMISKSTKWRCCTPSDISYVSKLRPKILSTLHITHLEDPNPIRRLCKAVAGAKIIFSLTIEKDSWLDHYKCTKSIGSLLNAISRCQKLSFRYNHKLKHKTLDRSYIHPFVRLRRCKDLSSLKIDFACNEETKNRILSRLSQQLTGNPKLKTLNFNINYCYRGTYRGYSISYDPNASLLKFKYPKCLSSLILHFERAETVNQELISSFISNLRRCAQLKNLKLNTFTIPPETLHFTPLFKTIQQNLETLILKKQFHEANVHPFLEDFSHLKNLITLDLYIASHLSSDQLKIFTTTLSSHLASLQSFKSLTLQISPMKNHDPEFRFFFRPLQDLKYLEQLTIHLPSVANLPKTHFQSLHQTLKNLHCLKKLDLKFPSETLSFDGLAIFVQSLKNLPCLDTLSLYFTHSELHVEEPIEFSFDSLTDLPLTSFSFSLGANNISEKRIKLGSSPFSTLFSCKLLSKLEIDLSVFKVSAQEALTFSHALKDMKQLLELEITLPEFDSANDFEGFRNFSTGLKGIPKLKYLSMTFRQEHIRDGEIDSLTSSLQDCASLKTLHMYFCKTEELTDNLIKLFLRRLNTFLSLKELKIQFSRENKFSQGLIFELLDSLMAIQGLEVLVLNFSSNPAAQPYSKDLLKYLVLRHLTTLVVNNISIL